MATLGMILMVVGYIFALVCGIWLLVVTFQTSIGWGIGSLLVPFVSLIFVITHWDVAKKPFLYNLCAIPVILIGIALKAGGAHG